MISNQKTTDAIIEFRGVSRLYGAGDAAVHALDGVDLTFAAGEFVAIMGPSGSGKSTAMNIIGCLDTPSDGDYRFQGVSVGELDRNQRTLLRRHFFGFVFQGFNLLPRTTAVENVELPLPALALLAAGDTYTISSSPDTDWLATFRGRIGWTMMPNLLVYGTGGLAVTRLSVANSFADNVFGGAAATASESKLKAGWTVGAGLEWSQSVDWTIKAEYLYVDFGKVTATGLIANATAPGYGQGISTSSDLTAHVARIGVNRRF